VEMVGRLPGEVNALIATHRSFAYSTLTSFRVRLVIRRRIFFNAVGDCRG
jgi:hypothetical protein